MLAIGNTKPLSIKNGMMKKMVSGRDGTMCWIDENNEGRITAFWGSRQKWESIPDWDIDMPDSDVEGHLLDHGYDESIPVDNLSLDDMKKAAEFRGGNCLSSQFLGMSGKLTWKCAFGHEFKASPTLVLKAGHWCPECLAPPWDYDRSAKKNPFLAQVYYVNHDKDESCYYDEKCYKDILQHSRN